MKVLFERKFLKEVSKVDRRTKFLVEQAILHCENAKALSDIENFKKLRAPKMLTGFASVITALAFIFSTIHLFSLVCYIAGRFTGISLKNA